MLVRTSTFLFFVLITTMVVGQPKNFLDVPYLETAASSDTLVIPDRIYFNIVVSEKDAKGDMTLETLQAKMEETLMNLGINTKEDLELADLVSNFRRYFLKGQDIVKTKMYSLVVKDATTAGKVIVALEELNISNVSLQRLEHSKKADIMLILKAKAIRKSKQYADVMASELNQKAGQAIFISDLATNEGDRASHGQASRIVLRGNSSFTAEGKYSEPDLQFEKIKFETSVEVRYKLN